MISDQIGVFFLLFTLCVRVFRDGDETSTCMQSWIITRCPNIDCVEVVLPNMAYAEALSTRKLGENWVSPYAGAGRQYIE